MLLKTWKKEERTPILRKFDAVILVEEKNVLKAKSISYSLGNLPELDLVGILGVDDSREAEKIANLYNKMISKRVRPNSLLSIVEAINILGDNFKKWEVTNH